MGVVISALVLASACFCRRLLALSLALLALDLFVVVVGWTDTARRTQARTRTLGAVPTVPTVRRPFAGRTCSEANSMSLEQGGQGCNPMSREKLLDDDTERLDHDDALLVEALVRVQLVAVD